MTALDADPVPKRREPGFGRRAEARFQWRRALNAADTSDEPGLAERVEDKLQDGLHNPPFLDGVVIETNAANEANVPTTDTH